MQLHSNFNFNDNEAQNIIIGKVAVLEAGAPDGRINYKTGADEGLYLKKAGNWIHLGQIEALANGGIQITPVSGVQYLSVRVDGTTLVINGSGNLEVKENSIGNAQLDNANIRINDFAAPNANFSMADYRITNLGTPTADKDAATKEYVDTEIALAISAMGDFVGDWAGPSYPTVGSSGGAIKKGDWWRITAPLTLGTEVLEIGDALFAKADAPGTIATNWFALQNNVGEATSTALGLVRVSEAADLTATSGANTTRVVRIADLLARTATTTRTGIIQLATQAEVNAGSVTNKAVTPQTMAVYVNAQISATSFAANVGDGTATAIVFTHNFGTRDVQLEAYRTTTPWDSILVDFERTTTNSVTVRFKTAPAIDSFRFLCKKIA